MSYPAHVILRYEIEKALIEGDIEVEDIPALWNEKMQAYLGLDTIGNYRNGCMQDIPLDRRRLRLLPRRTPSARCTPRSCSHSVRQALPSLSEDIAAGNLQPLFHWLHNIWRHGSRFPTETLIANATGEALNPRYFRQHLETRYL